MENLNNKDKTSENAEKELRISDISSLFFCSEWEWNEGRPKCDKQCKECKKTQKKNEN
jgi:hypothetical protein